MATSFQVARLTRLDLAHGRSQSPSSTVRPEEPGLAGRLEGRQSPKPTVLRDAPFGRSSGRTDFATALSLAPGALESAADRGHSGPPNLKVGHRLRKDGCFMEILESLPDACRVSGSGIVVSWHAASTGTEFDVTQELLEMSHRYRERQRRESLRYLRTARGQAKAVADKELNEHFGPLFDPIIFHVFGPFDVLALQLVDSFSVATRLNLRASTSMQVSMNALPSWANRFSELSAPFAWRPESVYPDREPSDADRYELRYPKKFKDLPLITVSLFKLNPYLLMAGGTRTVRELLWRVSTSAPKYAEALRICALEPLGWNEVTFVIHGNDFTDMVSWIAEVSEMRLRDLGNTATQRIVKEFRDRKIGDEAHARRLADTNLFATAWTTAGFRMDRFLKLLDLHKKCEDLEAVWKQSSSLLHGIKGRVSPVTRVVVRPGQQWSTTQDLNRLNVATRESRRITADTDRQGKLDVDDRDAVGSSELSLLIGKFDQIATFDWTARPLAETASWIMWHTRMLTKLEDGSDPENEGAWFQSKAFRTATELLVPIHVEAETKLKLVFKDHGAVNVITHLSERLGDRFENESRDHQPELSGVNIRDACHVLGFPRHVIDELRNMHAAYDSHLQDPILFFDVFLALGSFLRHLDAVILKAAADARAAKLNERIRRTAVLSSVRLSIREFKAGFSNRYNASFPLSELPDLSLEFKGGIQHVLTALDGFLRATMTAVETEGQSKEEEEIWNSKLTGFSVIGEASNIMTRPLLSGSVVHLNVSEMLQPERFAVFGHELLHYLTVLPEFKTIIEVLRLMDKRLRAETAVTLLRDKGTALVEGLANRHKTDQLAALEEHTRAVAIEFGEFRRDQEWRRRDQTARIFEEIAADQLGRDICFGVDNDELFRFFYWTTFDCVVSSSRMQTKEERFVSFIEYAVRYLLTARYERPPLLSSVGEFRDAYEDELLHCRLFVDEDCDLAFLFDLPTAKADLKWAALFDRFSLICGIKLHEKDCVVLDELMEVIADDSDVIDEIKSLQHDSTYAEGIRGVDFLHVMRRTLWFQPREAKLRHAGDGQDNVIPEKGIVAVYEPEMMKTYDGRFRPHSVYAPLAYCRDLLSKYFSFLMTAQPRPLPRDTVDGDIVDYEPERHGKASLFFDPLGGTFCPDPNFRSKSLRGRIAFIFSLWDMALKMRGGPGRA